MLNLGQMPGAGIYFVPGVILNSLGSIGLLFTFRLLAPFFALGSIMIYSEYASMFPKRSGVEVVYSPCIGDPERCLFFLFQSSLVS
ncbi:hypothetical protein BDR04DRAFT_38922 [Suillus decipiens]|nr:hypothetical protein BDR04DRAFT_38922 [Suillus decipiens]